MEPLISRIVRQDIDILLLLRTRGVDIDDEAKVLETINTVDTTGDLFFTLLKNTFACASKGKAPLLIELVDKIRNYLQSKVIWGKEQKTINNYIDIFKKNLPSELSSIKIHTSSQQQKVTRIRSPFVPSSTTAGTGILPLHSLPLPSNWSSNPIYSELLADLSWEDEPHINKRSNKELAPTTGDNFFRVSKKMKQEVSFAEPPVVLDDHCINSIICHCIENISDYDSSVWPSIPDDEKALIKKTLSQTHSLKLFHNKLLDTDVEDIISLSGMQGVVSFPAAHLTHLMIETEQSIDLSNIPSMKHLKNLQHLELLSKEEEFYGDQLEALIPLTALKYLKIIKLVIETEEPMVSLFSLPLLETIELDSPVISNELLPYFANFPSLKKILIKRMPKEMDVAYLPKKEGLEIQIIEQ